MKISSLNEGKNGRGKYVLRSRGERMRSAEMVRRAKKMRKGTKMVGRTNGDVTKLWETTITGTIAPQ